jgi:cytochrome b6-f complex iron-sulfur subunit
MSIADKIRAQAAAKKAASGDAVEQAPAAAAKAVAPAESVASDKPMSKLEAIRAAAAAKKAAAGGEAPAKGESTAAIAVEAKEKPARPLPPKPAKPKGAEGITSGTRRSFVTWIGVAWAAFTAGCASAVLAGVRFLYPNVLQEPPTVFKIGTPDKFEEGNVYEQWKNEFGAWIVKNNGELYAIRTVCTHLGCTPNWLEGEQKFKCPCHGSGFRKTGINFEGPAPRPLERFQIKLADDGQVEIDKGKKFQQELGQWTAENGAFMKV